MRMVEDKESIIIDEYTDDEAIEDGVLVPLYLLPGIGPVNRVTRAVWVHFLGEKKPKTLEPLLGAIRAMLALSPDRDGWRTGTYQDKRLWLVPNEVGGSTLMFPDDY